MTIPRPKRPSNNHLPHLKRPDHAPGLRWCDVNPDLYAYVGLCRACWHQQGRHEPPLPEVCDHCGGPMRWGATSPGLPNPARPSRPGREDDPPPKLL